MRRAIILTQLVERLLQTPAVRGSNPVNDNFINYPSTVLNRRKIKGNDPIKKIMRCSAGDIFLLGHY